MGVENIKINGKTLIEVASDFAVNSLDSRESLSEFNKGTQLVPSVLFDRAIMRFDPTFVTGLSQTLLDRYIGHYLMAVSALTKVGDVTVEQLLEPLSTSRSTTINDVSGYRTNLAAAYEWEKPTGKLIDYSAPELTFEASSIDSDLSKPASMAVGKLLAIPLSNGKNKVTATVMARLNPIVLESDGLVKLLEAFIGNDQSVIGRWHKLWANEISLADYITSKDIIQEERKLELEDKTGMYKNIKDNSRRNFLSTLLSGKKGRNVASSMIILTDDVAERLEMSMRGKFKDMRTREQFFKLTQAFILCVINPGAERIKMYERGDDRSGIFTFDDVKPAAASASSSSINDIMKAYRAQENMNY